MTKKYIIGGIVGLVFVVLAIMSFDETKIEYAGFEKAKQSGEIVQIIGSCSEDKDYNYDAQANEFHFTMVDEEGKTSKVIYSGAKPNNFDIAPMLVVKGNYENDVFRANHILTKCPSKYEGTIDDLKGKNLYQESKF